MTNLVKTLLASALLIGATGVAQAETLAKAQLAGAKTGTNTTYADVPLNNAGLAALSFNVDTQGIYYFTYNAECSAGDAAGWVSVQIVIDGSKEAYPRVGTDFALCSGGTEGTRYVGATRRGYVKLNPGAHTVSVQAARRNGPAGAEWRLDDALLTVEN